MEKQKFDRMKKILGILVLVFIVVPLTIVSADDRSLHDENLGFPHHIDDHRNNTENYAVTPYGSFWDAAYTYCQLDTTG